MTIRLHAGGIHLARPAPGGRGALILITGHDLTGQLCTVTLLSPDIEFGTSLDLVLTPADSGLAYRLLAQADLYGQLPADQCGPQLGQVGPGVLDALSALRDDDVVRLPVAGPPAWLRSDPRWQFKVSELDRLQELNSPSSVHVDR